MANYLLKLPNSFRTLSVSASTSSDGSPSTAAQPSGPVIAELPLDKIRRPLVRTRVNDPQKVKELAAFQVAIDMKLTSSWGYLPYAVRFVAGQRKP